jgi:glycosyltransferase involved in cell wall biosynthesis
MNQQTTLYTRFKALNACVLIPTFNNAGTLADVIRDVAEYTNDIIVVNDGSTDSTPKILPSFDFCRVLNQPSNLGKGRALRDGFTYARSLGYDYAITMDADGQHFAKDLHRFLDKLESSPGTLIVGARNMDQETVPSKSSFGNRFSNFWFKLETGIQLPDSIGSCCMDGNFCIKRACDCLLSASGRKSVSFQAGARLCTHQHFEYRARTGVDFIYCSPQFFAWNIQSRETPQLSE